MISFFLTNMNFFVISIIYLWKKQKNCIVMRFTQSLDKKKKQTYKFKKNIFYSKYILLSSNFFFLIYYIK